MSIAALALRTITVQALKGATLAGSLVFDSAIDPNDPTLPGEGRLALVVTTDDDKASPDGKSLISATREVDLVIDLFVARAVTVSIGDDEQRSIEVPFTDAGLEISLNLMGRQVYRALLASDTVWGQLWRRAIVAVPEVISRRAGGTKDGIRFAWRQTVFQARTLAEPEFGPATGFWADFLDALAGLGAAYQDLADLIRAEIETPSLDDWRRIEAGLAISDGRLPGLGFGPYDEEADDVVLTEIDVTSDTPGLGLTVDEATAGDALGPAEDA